MSHLLRSHAPITSKGWELIDTEARERLSAALGARQLVDFNGPHGWEHSTLNLGRSETVGSAPCPDVRARQRRVLALAELRSDFTVSREELADGDRGAVDIDLDSLVDAARRIAVAENIAVLRGWPEVGITGIAEASPHDALTLAGAPDGFPEPVAQGVETLRQSGIDGPYGMALGPDEYTLVMQASERGGFPLFRHLQTILDGPIVWSPGLRGAIVLSVRGGDFLLDVGQDLSVGYRHHDAEAVQLYIEESLTFLVATPEAAVALSPG